ncbi:scoloptoxin SSD976-like [Haemaphysalis longicornis]
MRHFAAVAAVCTATVRLAQSVDATSRSAILKAHNDYRSLVARGQLRGFPPAADMQELLWDDHPARVAQAHAELCQFAHDDANNRCTRRFDVAGQNIAISTSTGAGLAATDLRLVIWAKSRYVGCGFTYYHYAGGVGWPYKQLYTCKYGPSGNYRGKPVYQEGPCVSSWHQPQQRHWPLQRRDEKRPSLLPYLRPMWGTPSLGLAWLHEALCRTLHPPATTVPASRRGQPGQSSGPDPSTWQEKGAVCYSKFETPEQIQKQGAWRSTSEAGCTQ